ncbi:MAG: hypothetical protein JNJ98_17955 [Gemmatimonadetes bacterium]|nr:hypothetical protein [Gemmatimonadota bacterium]
MTTWDELHVQARRRVDAVADDPQGRLELRMEFYRTHGDSHALIASGAISPDAPDAEFGYGRSELDFMRWEIRRGVLNPVDGAPGARGSAWWRAVNADFLVDGVLASLGHEAGLPAEGAPRSVEPWLRWIASPGAASWYRAHNTSIIAGYAGRLRLAAAEQRPEQVFVNLVLYRVLFAQAMVEGAEFGTLGRFLANPRLPSVDLMVHLPDFYPDHYPLSPSDIRHVMHRGHGLEEAAVLCLDEAMIHPQLMRLYAAAARWNRSPELTGWITDGEPAYPSGASASPWLRAATRLWSRIRRP